MAVFCCNLIRYNFHNGFLHCSNQKLWANNKNKNSNNNNNNSKIFLGKFTILFDSEMALTHTYTHQLKIHHINKQILLWTEIKLNKMELKTQIKLDIKFLFLRIVFTKRRFRSFLFDAWLPLTQMSLHEKKIIFFFTNEEEKKLHVQIQLDFFLFLLL